MAANQLLDPLASLRRTGEVLSTPLHEAVLALGHEAVPGLIALLEDEEDAREDSPSEGWAPIHAARLLIELGATEAIEPLLRVLKSSNTDEVIFSAIEVNLPKLGEPVLEPALRHLDEENDEDVESALLSIVSELGIRDERIYERLQAFFESNRLLGAICLGSYGDERALPSLRLAIEEFEPLWESDFGLMELREFVGSYELIDGQLPVDLARHVAHLTAEWNAVRARAKALETPAVSQKIGRNEPCPCESGKKYKKCCG